MNPLKSLNLTFYQPTAALQTQRGEERITAGFSAQARLISPAEDHAINAPASSRRSALAAGAEPELGSHFRSSRAPLFGFSCINNNVVPVRALVRVQEESKRDELEKEKLQTSDVLHHHFTSKSPPEMSPQTRCSWNNSDGPLFSKLDDLGKNHHPSFSQWSQQSV